MHRIPLLLALLLVALPARAAGPDPLDGWWNWRGPLATGEAPRGKPPLRWDEKTNIAWKTALPGRGSSTPIVVGDRVFVLAAEDTGRKADAKDLPKPNPRLKVMVNGGYYDLATPFYAAYYEDKHLPIPESLAKNIEFDWYESGHMVYVRDESLQQLHDRVAAFIRSTEAGNK